MRRAGAYTQDAKSVRPEATAHWTAAKIPPLPSLTKLPHLAEHPFSPAKLLTNDSCNNSMGTETTQMLATNMSIRKGFDFLQLP